MRTPDSADLRNCSFDFGAGSSICVNAFRYCDSLNPPTQTNKTVLAVLKVNYYYVLLFSPSTAVCAVQQLLSSC